jgi:NADP-dependent 3-hydroxy acid dehydrogenase YdfG
MKNLLQNKTALVTGATAGIGLSTARLLASHGAKVFALGRREDRLLQVQKEFPKLIHPVVCDLTGNLKELDDKIPFSEIDILINNAGLALGTEKIDKTPVADWKQMFETNVFGLIALTQKVLPSMIDKNRGDIVNLGSIAGYQTYSGGSIYNATKFAVRALTEAWRKDLLGKNIRVIGIHPGMVETEFSEVRLKGNKEQAKKVYQGFQPLTAADIAESIVWSLQRPSHVNIESLVIMPTAQAAVGMVAKSE